MNNSRPLRTLVTGAGVILGGIATLNLASTVTLKALSFASETKRVKIYELKCTYFFFSFGF